MGCTWWTLRSIPKLARWTSFDTPRSRTPAKRYIPSYVEGQIQGGAVQGIGWALNEEYYFGDDGTMQNSTFLDYRMPTSLDLPMIDTVIVEVANPGHPYGVRGVGEVSIVPPMAAIANAIHDATGRQNDQTPHVAWGCSQSSNGRPMNTIKPFTAVAQPVGTAGLHGDPIRFRHRGLRLLYNGD